MQSRERREIMQIHSTPRCGWWWWGIRFARWEGGKQQDGKNTGLKGKW